MRSSLLYEIIPYRLSNKHPALGSTRGPYTAFSHRGTHFHGLEAIENIFIFGDSWTSTGFEENGEQPSIANPFGNPEYPGATATNGPNWVGYLTAVQNITLVKTFNFAYGGSTVDLELIHPDVPALRDLKYQINEQYLAYYVNAEPRPLDWSPENTLFIVWIGLNDIHNANNETAKSFAKAFEEFAKDVDILYQSGARNLLFLNIPPIDRSPLAPRMDLVREWKQWVSEWNTNLTSLTTNFTETYPDATGVVFDTFEMFNDMIDYPCTFEQSCGFEDVNTFCNYYVFGAKEWNHKDPHCDKSIDKYLWMNDLHPTTPVFNVTAQEIVRVMTSLGA
ncbi:carbohydrate esterase family 16 [Lecanosticta acicola]|uniref:Carbohydrate esterase family 16 n=1 Tax=Lecanosticta acicola TaxID=111012 RepID=A0AAI8Z8S5_9PEZI|nr:carbohydrate esterase family 16 [Lecanosticta acicola]